MGTYINANNTWFYFLNLAGPTTYLINFKSNAVDFYRADDFDYVNEIQADTDGFIAHNTPT